MALHDRDYMRGPQVFARRGGSENMLYTLIGINVVVYLLLTVNPALGQYLMLSPAGIRGHYYYQLLSAAFTHFDFMHILLNMWGLYLFGRLVTPYLGPVALLGLYVAGGVAGNLLYLACNWHTQIPLLGASGAVFGITLAGAMFQPNREFLTAFLPFWPIKTKSLVVIYAILEVYSLNMTPSDGIAHLAHLGGFVGGYLFLKLLPGVRLNWDPYSWLMPSARRGPERPPARDDFDPRKLRNNPPPKDTPVSQSELDGLLDKISRFGINSLSPQELERLRKAREQMRGPGR